jgi:hypothetical protein
MIDSRDRYSLPMARLMTWARVIAGLCLAGAGLVLALDPDV